jgi:urea transport system permease protein
MFKRRVGGVYFAIITQAVALILSLGIDRPAGLHRRRQRHHRSEDPARLGHPHRQAKYILYFVMRALLLGCILLSPMALSGKLGKMLLAMRDKEDRVRFSGYDVSMFKVFVFCLAAALSGIGGAMFVLQVGFMSPSLVGIVPSIEMVIFAAVGGRAVADRRGLRHVAGELRQDLFSESFPQLWLFLMGGCSSRW